MTATPKARIAAVLGEHIHYGAGECRCGWGKDAEPAKSIEQFWEHQAAAIAALPDIAIVELPSADQPRHHPIYVIPRNDGVPPIRYTPIYRQSHMSPESARVFAAELLAAARAAGGES